MQYLRTGTVKMPYHLKTVKPYTSLFTPPTDHWLWQLGNYFIKGTIIWIFLYGALLASQH